MRDLIERVSLHTDFKERSRRGAADWLHNEYQPAIRRKNGMSAAKVMFVALLFSACSTLSTDPDLSLAKGSYILEQVNGKMLPVAFETGDCPREIYTGDLSLSPQVASRRPLYTMLVFLRLRCDPSKAIFPIELREAIRDFGEWTIQSSRVVFESDKGYGSYTAPIDGGPSATLLTVQFEGRQYTFRRSGQ